MEEALLWKAWVWKACDVCGGFASLSGCVCVCVTEVGSGGRRENTLAHRSERERYRMRVPKSHLCLSLRVYACLNFYTCVSTFLRPLYESGHS